MKVCITYTDLHSPFFENHFIDSFPFEEGVSLIVKKMPQKCKGGLFSEGWRDQMIEKQKFINENLFNCDSNELLVFSDVDVRFYGNIKDDLTECLSDHDIAFMKDHNSDEIGKCGGFFVLKPNDKIKEVFAQVLKTLQEFDSNSPTSFQTSEQQTINSVLNKRKDVKWKYLPSRYYTHGLYIEGIRNFSEENQAGLWWENKSDEEKENTFIVEDLKVHHANWAKGLDNKLELLDFIFNKKERGK